MAKSGNPLDRVWQHRWRSFTFLGCILAFLIGLRSPVSERVGELPKPLQALRQPPQTAQHAARLAARMAPSTD